MEPDQKFRSEAINMNSRSKEEPDSWDPVWENIFKSQEWGKYPPVELIRFIARNYYKVPDRKQVRILDLGCGIGAASWYLAREGFQVWGVDGSKTAIEIAERRFHEEQLEGVFSVGDFIRLDFEDNVFDCLVDINAVQQNMVENIRIILAEACRVLKPGGKIFSIMMSDGCSFADDTNPMANKGTTSYTSIETVKDVFSMFRDLNIERSDFTDRGNLISNHIISAEKHNS